MFGSMVWAQGSPTDPAQVWEQKMEQVKLSVTEQTQLKAEIKTLEQHLNQATEAEQKQLPRNRNATF